MFSNSSKHAPPGLITHARFRNVLFTLAGIILLFASTGQIRAQEYYSSRSILVEDLIEKIARESIEELDYQTLFQDIYNYLENPLNLNTATREELEKLHLLTDFQVLSLQKYIQDNGPLLSIYELPLVYGFDEISAQTIEPLVTFETPGRDMPAREMPAAKRKSSHQLLLRASSVLEEQKGYSDISDSALAANPNSRYMGNRLHIMTKYRYRWGNKLQLGYNGDKDAGEPFFSGENKKGFDFNSAYLQVNDVWKFKNIIAGDFQVRGGQGLSLWSGLAFGKSPDIVNTRKKGSVLNPYSSIGENRFLRGVSASMELGDIDLTGFFSHKRIDANLLEDTLNGENFFSSFQSTGYHRTPSEFEDKDALRETVTGGNLRWDMNRLRLGASFIHYFFDSEFQDNSAGTSASGLQGNSNSNLGVDYSMGLKRIIVFGEFSYSTNSSNSNPSEQWAIINGANFELHPQLSLSVLHRYLGTGFYSHYGNAFRENSRNTNENGLYMGLELRPLKDWKFTAYLDAYRFPFLAETIAEQISGFDYHLQAEYLKRDKITAYLRYRFKTKPKNVNSLAYIPNSGLAYRGSQLRFNISYRVAEALTFQNRLEISFYESTSKESGWLAYHDILYKPSSFPLSFSFRYAMFDTKSYNSRIYTYEHDVLYAFSIPSWYGRGIRTYLNTRWVLGDHVDLWFKYALSWYPDRETISSGLNEIEGHHRQDINVQLRLKF